MPCPPERIEDILAFVRAADLRSFTVAAEQPGLCRSTIGKRITRLEARLGVRLLHRTTRNVTPTDEGAVFHGNCVEILQALEAAEAAAMVARSISPTGRLRIDVPVSLGRLQIMPVVHDYMGQWPMVAVAISFNDRYVDLIDEGIDVAVRVGGMVPVLAAFATEGAPLSVVYPVRRSLPPKIKAFVDLLRTGWQPVPPWDRDA